MQNTRREIEIIQKRIELNYETDNYNKNIIHELQETLVYQIENLNGNHEELNSRVNLIIENKILPHTGTPKRHYCISDAFIHNRKMHKNGVAIIQKGEDHYSKAPLISVREYDKRKKRMIWRYKV